jgi:hypothetical protein
MKLGALGHLVCAGPVARFGRERKGSLSGHGASSSASSPLAPAAADDGFRIRSVPFRSVPFLESDGAGRRQNEVLICLPFVLCGLLKTFTYT